MPPLLGPLSKNFSRDAGGLLTRAGHGRLLVICDPSYDLPDGAHEFYYLGNERGDLTAAAALREIAAACPLDRAIPGRYMAPDADDPGTYSAPARNHAVLEELGFRAQGQQRLGADGMYTYLKGKDPAKPPLHCLVASADSYDNIAVEIGFSGT
ncbi:MAG TPA: hypothetical protein VG899_09105 [Mycobacteriales bacterium]|nr:hypothetical protein [Mycobacteriales bacterium]HWA66509.1 hypothetical protein [Mycobacteriales bacterium]